jgi:nucleotide-binding universal stress UspA family protein
MSYERIIVATDLTDASDEVVRTAADLASRLEAELVAVYVLTETRLTDLRESLPPEGAYVDVIEQRIAADLDDQLARVAEGITHHPRVVTGDEAKVVHRLAQDEDADLVVIGLRNRSRVGKLLMGSTAQEILLGSPCPVMGVPI